MTLEERCARYPQGVDDPNCTLGNWNWLGTDDQGRDVVARLIYGFRISVAVRPDADDHLVGHRRAGRRGAGLFRRLDRPRLPALHRDLDVDAGALSAAHHLVGASRRASWCCSASCCCSPGSRWSAWCAPSSCAAATSNTSRAARALGVSDCEDHVPPPPAQRHGGDADLHAVHPQRLGHHADLARFPRLRPAARLALAGRAAGPGQGQPPGAVARPHRLLRHRRSC